MLARNHPGGHDRLSMARKPPTPEEVRAELSAELKKRRLTPDGRVHEFYRLSPTPDQVAFLACEARTQIVLGSNRSGKSRWGRYADVCHAIGKNPATGAALSAITDIPYLGWIACPPKNTRDEVNDIAALIPPGITFKTWRTPGAERVEFAPTPLRPLGAAIKVKSYGMPREEFQRDAVHRIRFDEEGPEGIWTECEQRLISTKGTLVLSFTPVNGATWLWKKLRELKSEYYKRPNGEFSWFRLLVKDNPGVDFDEVKFRSQNLSEDEYAIRVEGQYILMAGSQYFPAESLKQQWDSYSKNPEWTMNFNEDGEPVFTKWSEKSRGWSVWKKPSYGERFAIGADVGKGLGSDADFSVATVLNTEGEMVAVYSSNEVEPWEYGQELLFGARHFNDAIVAPEVNIEASAALHALRQFGYPHIYRRKSFGGKVKDIQNSLGWYTDSRSKGACLEELRAAIRKGGLGQPGGVLIPDAKTLNELSDFGHLKERRPGAYGLGGLSGHDDRVLALAIAFQALKQSPRGRALGIKAIVANQVEQWEQEAIAESRAERAEELGDW